MSYYNGIIPGARPSVPPRPALPPRPPSLTAQSQVPPRPPLPPRPSLPSPAIRPQPPSAGSDDLSERFSRLNTRPSEEPPPYSPSQHAGATPSEQTNHASSPQVRTASPEVSVVQRRRSPRPHVNVPANQEDNASEASRPMPTLTSVESESGATDGRTSRHYSTVPSIESQPRSSPHPTHEHNAPPPLPRRQHRSLDRIARCPKAVYVDWCTWYHTESVPGFDVCEECYTFYIQPTEFDRHFQLRPVGNSYVKTCCDFNRPRMKQVWDEAVRTRDFETASAYMTRRSVIPACQGLQGVKISPETAHLQWYMMRNNEVEGFVACEACYEDVICSTSFVSCFQPNRSQQQLGTTVICDMSHPFFKKAFDEHAKSGDWRGFVELSNVRCKISPCAGDVIANATSKKWYKPRSYIQDVYVCAACYFDVILLTPWRDHFEPVQTQILTHIGLSWKCCLGIKKLRLSWDIMMDEKAPFEIWWNAARVLATTPACKNEGVENHGWYVLADGCDNFDVCPSCFHCYFSMFPAFAQRFRLQHYPRGTMRVCDFAPGGPRAGIFLVKFGQAVDRKDFSIFADYVRAKAHLPPCPRSNLTKNFRWWGVPNGFTCCEECFKEVVEGTPLDPQLTVRGEVAEHDVMCELYSPRMRGLWAEACRQNDISQFVAAAQERRNVYMATMPQCQMILSMMRMRMSMRNTQLLASTIVMGSDGIVGAASPVNHTHYGNSSVGYGWNTSAGAEAAMQNQQAMGMQVVSGNEMMQVAQLESMWKQVE